MNYILRNIAKEKLKNIGGGTTNPLSSLFTPNRFKKNFRSMTNQLTQFIHSFQQNPPATTRFQSPNNRLEKFQSGFELLQELLRAVKSSLRISSKERRKDFINFAINHVIQKRPPTTPSSVLRDTNSLFSFAPTVVAGSQGQTPSAPSSSLGQDGSGGGGFSSFFETVLGGSSKPTFPSSLPSRPPFVPMNTILNVLNQPSKVKPTSLDTESVVSCVLHNSCVVALSALFLLIISSPSSGISSTAIFRRRKQRSFNQQRDNEYFRFVAGQIYFKHVLPQIQTQRRFN